MEKEQKIKVGISIGDINGIGVEVILKTFADARMLDFCTPVLFGSTKIISYYKKTMQATMPINGISTASKALDKKINVVNCWQEDVKIEAGQATNTGGTYALKSLEAATAALKNGFVDVLVTAPINKETIQSDDFKFPGHTEYLEAHLEGKSLMILMTDNLRVALITGHIPISEIATAITPQLIKDKVAILHKTLVEDFSITKPKIAILGLNPHCGDHGVIGKEDDEVIAPTIAEIQNENKLVYGPFAADGFFGTATYTTYDAVLAMYHDQGLAPFKALSFGKGVNFTAGLEKIRTSPDHGTAFEIAGKNKANESSFKEALFTAIKLYKTRTENALLADNVLKVKRVRENNFR